MNFVRLWTTTSTPHRSGYAHAVNALKPLVACAIREARPLFFSGWGRLLDGIASCGRTGSAAEEGAGNRCAEGTDENSYLQTRHD